MTDGGHASVIALGELAETINAARPALDPAGERVALTLYRLLAEGEPWIERHPGTFVLTVEQAFELGQITNRRQFPIALR